MFNASVAVFVNTTFLLEQWKSCKSKRKEVGTMEDLVYLEMLQLHFQSPNVYIPQWINSQELME